jgi:hypothetical protein
VKYNLYINQKAVFEHFGNQLNANDCIVFDCISNLFINHKDLYNTYYENKLYIWCKTTLVKIECPLLDVSETQIKNIIIKLCNLGLLERHPENEKLKKMFLTLGDKAKLLTNNDKEISIKKFTDKKFIEKNLYKKIDRDNITNNKDITNTNNITNITNKDNNKLNNNINNEIEFLKSKQLELLGEYKDDIIDLYEYKFFNDLVIDNNDSKYKIDAMLKTDEFALIEKKCRKLKSQIIKPETINRKNLINYFNDIGKIQVSDNIFLYPYEIIKLRMVYNPKFLTKKVREFDNFCFEDKNFKRYIDHYSTIKNWLDTEIEKVKKNPKYEKSEIYHYYNWGVSRNEI